MGCEVVYADELQHVHTVCTKPSTMRFHPRARQPPSTIAAILIALIAIARMVDGYATQWRCPAGDDGSLSRSCVGQYPTRLPIVASLCPTEDSIGPWSCLDTISTSSDADIVGDIDCGWCGFQAEQGTELVCGRRECEPDRYPTDRCPTDRLLYSYRRVNGCSIKCNTSLLKSIQSISSCFTECLPNCHHHGCHHHGCHHHNCQVNCQVNCQPKCQHKYYPK